MENTKQTYQAPELKEWGAVAEITQDATFVKEVRCGSVDEYCATL